MVWLRRSGGAGEMPWQLRATSGGGASPRRRKPLSPGAGVSPPFYDGNKRVLGWLDTILSDELYTFF
jgi:hypothetical protein